jgi:hypothetical protein
LCTYYSILLLLLLPIHKEKATIKLLLTRNNNLIAPDDGGPVQCSVGTAATAIRSTGYDDASTKTTADRQQNTRDACRRAYSSVPRRYQAAASRQHPAKPVLLVASTGTFVWTLFLTRRQGGGPARTLTNLASLFIIHSAFCACRGPARPDPSPILPRQVGRMTPWP